MENTKLILTLVVGIACASVLIVEVSGIMGWIKSKMFKRLKSCWKKKYTKAELELMMDKELITMEEYHRLNDMIEQVRRVPFWMYPFRVKREPCPPSAWQPEVWLHFKPFGCIPCFSTWAGVIFSIFWCQSVPDFILLIGGTPIAALILTKLIRQ